MSKTMLASVFAGLALIALGTVLTCTSHPLSAIQISTFVERRDDHQQPQQPSTPIDILFVIDDSGSMATNQANLAANLPGFIDLISKTPADFQLAVISTDMDDPAQSGRILAAPGNPKILNRNTPNLKQVFADNVKLGTRGSGFEQPLKAMETALSDPLLSGDNAGFLRGNALLGVVVVSDEEDCSYPPGLIDESGDDNGCYEKVNQMIPVQHYFNFLTSLKGGDPSKILFAGVVGPDIPAQTSIDACATDAECASGRCWDFTNKCCLADPTFADCKNDSECSTMAGTACIGRKCLPTMTERQYPPHQCSCFGRTFGAAAVPGTRVLDMVKSFGTNGFYASICADDWNKTLQALGGQFANLVCSFSLGALKTNPNQLDPSVRDIIIKINSVELTTGWKYNCPDPGNPNGSVSFDSSACPPYGATFDIFFEPASTDRTPQSCGTRNPAGSCPSGQQCGNCGYCAAP
jgi:hypothetical protein